MEFFKTATRIDFVGKNRIMVTISAILCAVCLVSMVTRGFNFGIDFAGGTVVEFQAPEALGPIDEGKVRSALSGTEYADASVVRVGPPEDRTFRVSLTKSQEENRNLSVDLVKELGAKLGGDVTMRSSESIGPRVGAELRRSALIALTLSWLAIMLYVWYRFEWKYAPGGVIALVHDVVITAGMFSIFQWEFDLNVLAALLVIIGYSINDTIVIYDRIRETVATRGETELDDVVNQALNATLSRTVLTSGLTLLVVVSILILGGPVLRGMALALLIGMLSGVYSTVYVASATLLWLGRRYGRVSAPAERKARAAT